MGPSSVIVLVFFTLVPLAGPFNALGLIGFVLWPWLAARWAYDRVESLYWVGAAVLAFALWLLVFALFWR
jgi:hypothetical protein